MEVSGINLQVKGNPRLEKQDGYGENKQKGKK